MKNVATKPAVQEEKEALSQEGPGSAISFIDSILEAVPSRFKTMTEGEIKQERLKKAHVD